MQISRRDFGLLTLGATVAALVSGCGDDELTSPASTPDREQTILGMIEQIPYVADTTNVTLGIGLWDKAIEQTGIDRAGQQATTAELTRFGRTLHGAEDVGVAVLQAHLEIDLIRYGAKMRDTDGWDYSDLRGFIEVTDDGEQYTVCQGDFDRDRIDGALRANRAWRPVLTTPTYQNTTIYRWFDDYETYPKGFGTGLGTDNGDSHRFAFPDGATFLYTNADAPMEALLDVHAGKAKSLADSESIAALARALDDADAHSSFVDHDVAVGSSYHDGRSWTTIAVAGHTDAAQQISDTIKTGKDQYGHTWSSQYAVQKATDGDVSVVRLEPKGKAYGAWTQLTESPLFERIS